MDKRILKALEDFGLVTNICVDADKYTTVDDLIEQGVVTIPGAREKIYEIIKELDGVELVTEITENTETVIDEIPEDKPTIVEVPDDVKPIDEIPETPVVIDEIPEADDANVVEDTVESSTSESESVVSDETPVVESLETVEIKKPKKTTKKSE